MNVHTQSKHNIREFTRCSKKAWNKKTVDKERFTIAISVSAEIQTPFLFLLFYLGATMYGCLFFNTSLNHNLACSSPSPITFELRRLSDGSFRRCYKRGSGSLLFHVAWHLHSQFRRFVSGLTLLEGPAALTQGGKKETVSTFDPCRHWRTLSFFQYTKLLVRVGKISFSHRSPERKGENQSAF